MAAHGEDRNDNCTNAKLLLIILLHYNFGGILFMSRYTGPRWKLSRRLGISLSGSGKEIARRNYAPGQHGPNSRRKISEYGQQLTEKQKLRFMYDVNERQFRNLFLRAGKLEGIHGVNLMILLETRLDNVVYRLGLASSRPQARQLVNHGHITVDGKRVDIPSYEVQIGQKISLREKSKDLAIVKENLENVVGRPGFVSFDDNTLTGSLVRNPERNELEPNIDESLVVEYYNQIL
ncbi:30S ribosomal protein S4 [Companilactobacillus tucceti DSM 20183]|uniref:Small ribosomal subunit protein uS4 n=2 Tax=Companilactobacillus tucceti TaxID=238012 RepID=A0A0R1JA73_9LACO|nr:30S ribosomal protein S4 [Companilactobacillus tucceti DSM 20183]